MISRLWHDTLDIDLSRHGTGGVCNKTRLWGNYCKKSELCVGFSELSRFPENSSARASLVQKDLHGMGTIYVLEDMVTPSLANNCEPTHGRNWQGQ